MSAFSGKKLLKNIRYNILMPNISRKDNSDKAKLSSRNDRSSIPRINRGEKSKISH